MQAAVAAVGDDGRDVRHQRRERHEALDAGVRRRGGQVRGVRPAGHGDHLDRLVAQAVERRQQQVARVGGDRALGDEHERARIGGHLVPPGRQREVAPGRAAAAGRRSAPAARGRGAGTRTRARSAGGTGTERASRRTARPRRPPCPARDASRGRRDRASGRASGRSARSARGRAAGRASPGRGVSPSPNGAVSALRMLNALMLQVAHGIPWRCSITRAAAAMPGSATITSGRTSSSIASRSATWPGTALMNTSRTSNLNFATPFSFARSGNSASISLTSRSGAWTCGWNVAPVASTFGPRRRVPVDRVPARGELEGERDQRPDVAGGGHAGEEEARHGTQARRIARRAHRGNP